jgi:Zn-dependent protease
MISLPFVLHAALFVLALLCLQMLLRAGSGREIVRISRRSEASVETSWKNLLQAWEKTGLTFTPSDIQDSEEDGTRTAVRRDRPDAGAIVFRPLPPPTDHSIIFSAVSVSGAPYPEGHFEHWRVEPDGTGSRIVVETRLRTNLRGTVRILSALWKQAGLVASPQAAERIAAMDAQPAAAPNAGRNGKAGATAPQRTATTRLPGYYGREAALSLIAFAYLLTQYAWQSAVVLAAVILWHEFGHVVAYRLTGKTGNRLMLVPFFGGVAVAGAPHKSEFEKAFCALMGPGICAPLSLGSFALWYYDVAPDYDPWFWHVMFFSSVLNLLNLLPIYPLDGGQAAESFLRSFLPSSLAVHLSGLAVAGLVVLVGYGYYQMALFVGIFSLIGLRNLPSRSHLPPMSGWQAMAMALFYALIAAAHASVFYYYVSA